jgi:LysM repeat protein
MSKATIMNNLALIQNNWTRKVFCSVAGLLMVSTIIIAQNPCSPSTQNGIHIVQKGETLYGISRKYKITLDQLTDWNNRDVNAVLLPCTALKVAGVTTKAVPQGYNSVTATQAPKAYNAFPKQPNAYAAATQPQVAPVPSPNYSYFYQSPYVPLYHQISYGETPESIAAQYGLSATDVAMMNNIGNNTPLLAGQKLVLEDRNVRKTEPYVLERVDNQSVANTQPTPANPNNTNPNTPSANKPTPPAHANPPLNNTTSMSSEELDMVKEINLVRSNPPAYIPYIQEYLANMKSSGMMLGDPTAAANELIAELRQTPPRSILQPLQCVYMAAKKHGEDQKRQGTNDHTGSDGSQSWDRILRECPNLKDGNENLVGGPASVRKAVILLLIDDGIETRGHRKTMLNPDWKYVACYKMGTVGSMPNCWVQNYGY